MEPYQSCEFNSCSDVQRIVCMIDPTLRSDHHVRSSQQSLSLYCDSQMFWSSISTKTSRLISILAIAFELGSFWGLLYVFCPQFCTNSHLLSSVLRAQFVISVTPPSYSRLSAVPKHQPSASQTENVALSTSMVTALHTKGKTNGLSTYGIKVFRI